MPFVLLLAVPAGYLLGWFLYGLPALPLLGIVLAVGLALAFQGGRRREAGGFITLLLMALGGALLLASLFGVLYLALGFLNQTASSVPGELLMGLTTATGLGLIVSLGLVWLVRTFHGQAGRAWAPWLFIAGVLAFAFFPAVRVDCRGLQNDTWLSFQGTLISSSPWDSAWRKHPEQLPDRAELPAGFVPERVRPMVTRCFQDASWRNRIFSFRPSAPLLLVYVLGPGGREAPEFAALFTPGNHQKLTPWTATRYHLDTIKVHRPYRNPAWVVYAFMPELPAELKAALK